MAGREVMRRLAVIVAVIVLGHGVSAQSFDTGKALYRERMGSDVSLVMRRFPEGPAAPAGFGRPTLLR